MKLSRDQIAHMAESLASHLLGEGQLELVGARQALVETLGQAIIDELRVEDRLNEEIRQLMKRYEAEIERGHADYQKMFTMIKNRLVKERGLIL
ncbi:MAG: DUF507 family protein [Nitrospiraceae bacterium]